MTATSNAQLTDITQTPNPANAGIKKSLTQEIGAGRGDTLTPGSSLYIIKRDPFRAIVRGRQLFQRKFTVAQGFGPRTNDGVGDIVADASHGAGLADSCAACHSRPLGSAGFGGNVFTRPNSRDAPHLFGLGLIEMLGDEITGDLRAIEADAIAQAQLSGSAVTLALVSKGISYGSITGLPGGTSDTSLVVGVDPDLRVRPLFAQGGTISIREFLVGAFNAEMGLESPDPDLGSASSGSDVTTPSGMLLSGTIDQVEGPPAVDELDDADLDGVVNEIPTSLVDFMEFYLLNYFKPGFGNITVEVKQGFQLFGDIGCTTCHIPTLNIAMDRRVADVETVYNPNKANMVFNSLYATAVPKFVETDDGSGFPTLKDPVGAPFVVRGIFADFKRHDLGPGFHELNFDGSKQTLFMTEPLWGVASTPPYGHDGRSGTLKDVILRHDGEAKIEKEAFAALTSTEQGHILSFLGSLVLFAPPDTSSTLDEADPMNPEWPIEGKGSIDLSPLFVDPLDKE